MTDNKYQPSPSERANDTRLITPLVLMGLIIAGGLLFAAYHGGQTAPTVAQDPGHADDSLVRTLYARIDGAQRRPTATLPPHGATSIRGSSETID